MKITQLKCTNCGAKLEVKDNDKKVSCNYCGYDYILDDNKIIVEHVVIDEKDKVLFENAETFLNKLNDYHEAYLLYS